MHPKNIHNTPYDFEALIGSHPELAPHVFVTPYGNQSIDFSKPTAVLHLNKAILKHQYRLSDWNIPDGYLCPPIPGRADYIHHIADLLEEDGIENNVRGLDIGVGANCIYPILASQIYDWQMVGSDISLTSVTMAKANTAATPSLVKNIEIRHQTDPSNIFKGIISEGDHFHFSICNPPFHANAETAARGSLKKATNLGLNRADELNFGGQANELWCNGGEALFIKRMIKQSVAYSQQVKWFTTLVSKKENLAAIYKQLHKLKAVYKTVPMAQGNKQSRFVAWRF
ncbi:23S rRNA (adenine(1618)-N(6))-methyltransferase RlmF [Arenibacter sp. 6A1]|uniref:23S rRNA (adenine(1618)-N(6))-methyltransferase RlmF n=1 Tax=Arenibacter sp. 6A1 TaxID=2720391 RepID=UPI001445EB6B|nr:23S rRNA (adenine(1618)-N(6))-methyltransferase RlmF [Arenibacter sp. 6A1]NKI25855.1 23S rRNA (adenine(1618)-N(6))-methyltransferase RlmF [Arenibacter sp. 6A1]